MHFRLEDIESGPAKHNQENHEKHMPLYWNLKSYKTHVQDRIRAGETQSRHNQGTVYGFWVGEDRIKAGETKLRHNHETFYAFLLELNIL